MFSRSLAVLEYIIRCYPGSTQPLSRLGADRPRLEQQDRVSCRLVSGGAGIENLPTPWNHAGFPVGLDQPLDGFDNHLRRHDLVRYQIQPLWRSGTGLSEAERE